MLSSQLIDFLPNSPCCAITSSLRHTACPIWPFFLPCLEGELSETRTLHPLQPRIAPSPDPNTVRMGWTWGPAAISLQGPQGLFFCVGLSWFGVGRVGQGALPVFVRCNRRKSIGQKVRMYFLKAHNVVPSLARRKQRREVEKKNLQTH